MNQGGKKILNEISGLIKYLNAIGVDVVAIKQLYLPLSDESNRDREHFSVDLTLRFKSKKK